MGTTSKIETRYLQPEEYHLWDSFVDESRDGTIFHKTLWLKPISAWQNLNFSIAACFKGGKIVGGMAFTWKKKFGRIPVIQMPLKTPVFGPVISQSETKYQSKIERQVQATVQEISGFLMTKYQLFHAQFPPTVTDVRPYAWAGFNTAIHYTYRTQFNKDFNLPSIVESDINRRIKKASQLPYIHIVDNSKHYIGQAWDLEQKSFKRQKFQLDVNLRNKFTTLVQDLVRTNTAQVHTIDHDGKSVASIIMISDRAKKASYYWMAGADKDYLSTGLNQLLLIQVIQKYKDADFESIDLVGADTESIARYKSTFNLPLIPMYSVSKSRGIARLGIRIKNLIQ